MNKQNAENLAYNLNKCQNRLVQETVLKSKVIHTKDDYSVQIIKNHLTGYDLIKINRYIINTMILTKEGNTFTIT